MKCDRCGEETGSDYDDICNTCNDAVYGNPKREREIAKRIELLSLINKTNSLMTNDELEDVLLYMKNLCLSLISSPLKDFKKG